MMDLENIQTQRDRLEFRGAMGTTGSKYSRPPYDIDSRP